MSGLVGRSVADRHEGAAYLRAFTFEQRDVNVIQYYSVPYTRHDDQTRLHCHWSYDLLTSSDSV